MIYWLLPLAFVIHDAEELFTMPSWFVAHERPLGAAHIALAIALFFAVFVVIVTAVVVVVPGSACLWMALLRRGAIDLRASLAMSVLGIALFLPAVLGALWLSDQILSSFS